MYTVFVLLNNLFHDNKGAVASIYNSALIDQGSSYLRNDAEELFALVGQADLVMD